MTRTGFPARLRMSHEDRRLNTVHRRNGKLQSCEPCRKGKLRCDHMIPTCSRCLRRNKAEQCVYHPAPLTKSKTTVNERRSSTSTPTPTAFSTSLPSPLPSEARGSYAQKDHATPRSRASESDASQYLPTATGFLGPTSYMAVLKESPAGLGLEDELDILSVPAGVTAARVQRGMEILSLLVDMPLYEKMIDRWFKLCPGMIVIEPVVKQWTSELWATHRRVLGSRIPNRDELQRLSELVWKNTHNTLNFNRNTTPREWMSLSTGPNLRWEVIGIIFSIIGLLALTLLDVDPIFDREDGDHINRREFATQACEASEACLTFCRDLCLLNDLVLWCMYENVHLVLRIKGKSSYVSWARTGELANAIFAMGLHQEIKESETIPFFLAEFRKRTFVFFFTADKTYSTFIGRPPRLSKRYCVMQLPLDLTDAQLMSEGPALQSAIDALDKEGWNPSGTVHMCTAARVYLQQSEIREDILELSLGVSNEDIVEKAAQIQKRADAMYSSFPDFLQRHDDEIWHYERAAIDELFLIYIKLEYLNHSFLLQRALIRRASADQTELIVVAKKLLTNVLVLINNRDSMRDFQLDLCMTVYHYGLPSAAVLALEILRQDQNPGTGRVSLSRSDTIQDISVFTATLGSLSIPGDRQSIADLGRKFLKKVLDKILTPSPPVHTPLSATTGGAASANAHMDPGTDPENGFFPYDMQPAPFDPDIHGLEFDFDSQLPIGAEPNFMLFGI